MKTRNEIYQGEGAQLLRFITTMNRSYGSFPKTESLSSL